jgi:drug/metabolite transporter (DMT)-like permease
MALSTGQSHGGVTAVPSRAIVLLIILTIVWGTNWPLFKLATQEISVWTFRSTALLIAGATLLLVAKIQGLSLSIARQHWMRLGWATFFYLVIWNVASTYAAILIPSGQAAILGFTMPLWAAGITVIFLGEKISARLAAALALGALAVGLLMFRGLSAYHEAPLGFALGLLSGLGWAIGTIILKAGKITVPSVVLVGWQLVLSALPVGLGAMVLGDHQWFMPTWQTLAIVTYIALVPMCIGNLCWFMIVGMLPTNTAGISSIMVPMVAMLAGAAMHHEPLGLLQWVAMLCCAAALALTILKRTN